MTQRNLLMLGGGSALALMLVAAAPAALAQTEAATPAAAAQEPDQEIIVTGSRLARTSFNAPTPVNVVGAQRMEELAITNIGDALNQLPAFRAASSTSTPLFRVSGAIASRSLDLRGLGTSRTLVLVDGRRFVPSQDNGTVDLNGIPSALVERAEVVTGGASAAYGADAVAGVVNLILDTDLVGFKTDFSYGVSGEGDAENTAISMAGGAEFANGRGHFIAGIEYQDEKGVGACETRDYCAAYTNYVANPGFSTNPAISNGLPANLVLNNVLFVENPTGILVGAVRTVNGVRTTLGQQVNNIGAAALPAALRGKQFSADGQSLAPFQFGGFLSGLFMQGGDPSVDKLYGFGNGPLSTPSSHLSALGHVDYDVTDSITASAEFLYSRVEGGPVRGSVYTGTPAGGTAQSFGQGLSINNPFISPAVRAQILAADPNITSILVNVAKAEVGDRRVSTSTNDIWRTVLALEGEVFDGWNWDASYTHGETDSYTIVRNNDLRPIDGQAGNAITPPAGYAGTIYRTPLGAPVICASSATNPADGCIPANYLGANSFSTAVLDKYYADQYMTRSIVQDAFAANLRGSLFELPAGSVEGAVGLEFRRDEASGDTDELSLPAQNAFTAGQTTSLPRIVQEVTEGYVEASAPLLGDMPLVRSLTIDGAYRWTHYSTSGNAETWKVGVVYEPSDQILFRLTKSSDIRAPTAAELNPNTITTLLPLVDPFVGNTHQVASITGGNPGLGLETADTSTIGVVLQPSFIPGFRMSLDYYDIKVDGGIDVVAAPAILQACFQQNRLCDLITFSGANKASAVTAVFGNFQNLATIVAEGFELVSQYTIEDMFAGGDVDMQVNANYIEDLHSVGGTGLITRLDGVTGNAGSLTNVLGVPNWKLDATVTYAQPEWSVTAHARYIPESVLDPTKVGPEDPGYSPTLATSVNLNRVASAFYLDLAGTLRPTTKFLGGNVEIYGAINNVTDKYPPGALRFFGNPLHYDVVGRAFRLGFRSRW